jgi:hypothetical protein
MTRNYRRLFVVVAAFVLCVAFNPQAEGACFDAGVMKKLTGSRPQLAAVDAARATGERDSDARPESIVGLWRVAFFVGDGPDVAYEGFQQWHAGGTETMVDNGVPPSFGNVCVGVWKQAGSRTFRLRHVTFNWDENGRSTGTFQVLITVRLNASGTGYSGTYSADSFDLQGNVIPELHAEGRLRGLRLVVE